MSNLNDLAARVEALTGPDREVDAEIAIAIRWPPLGPMIKHWIHDWPAGLAKTDREGWVQLANYGGDSWKVPAFTASIDDAMTLVPEGWEWTINTFADPPKASAYCITADNVMVRTDQQYLATPALALTAAALRSRVQGEG